MNSLFIPWDFVLVLLFLGIIVPWRGDARMKRLLSKPELTTADRLSLYGSTIVFQWLIVAIVAWRCAARGVGPDELGLAASDSWQVAWTSIVLTGLLCVNQVVGLRKVSGMPEGKRGSLFAITEKIMPRTPKETLVYAALACTAGISEEFLYRGFVFMAFVRMIVNFGPAERPCRDPLVRMVLAGAFIPGAARNNNYICSRTDFRFHADLDREPDSRRRCPHWHRLGRWDLCIQISSEGLTPCQPLHPSRLVIARFAMPWLLLPFLQTMTK